MSDRVQDIEIDWVRLSLLGGALAISCAVGWFGQPLIENNKDAITTVVTIFSILAGFLIAVITFISQPALARAMSWEDLQKLKPEVEKKLVRQTMLFYLYLITLGLALAMFLTPEAARDVLIWMERAFLGLTVFVFLLSFALPGALLKIQMDQIEGKIEKGAPAGLKGSKDSAS